MLETELEKLRFPIGRFKKEDDYNQGEIENFIEILSRFPEKLNAEVIHLKPEQLDTPYRPDGWTIRQVVHHCADSHMNALIRFKHTIHQNKTIIQPYPEAVFAEMADSKTLAIEPSLLLLEGLHARISALAKSLSTDQLTHVYVHPEYKTEYSLKQALAQYAWHCKHHLAHITELKKNKNWK